MVQPHLDHSRNVQEGSFGNYRLLLVQRPDGGVILYHLLILVVLLRFTSQKSHE